MIRALGINPAIPAALRHAPDAASAGWAAWRAAAGVFDTVTTGKSAGFKVFLKKADRDFLHAVAKSA